MGHAPSFKLNDLPMEVESALLKGETQSPPNARVWHCAQLESDSSGVSVKPMQSKIHRIRSGKEMSQTVDAGGERAHEAGKVSRTPARDRFKTPVERGALPDKELFQLSLLLKSGVGAISRYEARVSAKLTQMR